MQRPKATDSSPEPLAPSHGDMSPLAPSRCPLPFATVSLPPRHRVRTALGERASVIVSVNVPPKAISPNPLARF